MHDKGLTAWQLTMLALGTVIGGSFFLGSAVAVRAAGPAVIVAFMAGGALVYVILYALSEMTVANPATGSFRTYAEKAYGPAVGFIVGWVYWTGLVLAMSSEAIAVSTLLRTWIQGLSVPVIGMAIIVIVTLLNLLGADRLSKLESGLAAVKLFAVAGFAFMGLVLAGRFLTGNAPVESGLSSQYPILPGGLGGLAGSMLIVMFCYAGFEVIGLAATETADPHTTVPRAITYTVAGVISLYVAAIAVLLLLAPAGMLTTDESPFVTVLTAWGYPWAGQLMNGVLVTAILSTMLAAMFGLGRMLRSLAEENHAPSWLRDRGDIPYRGILSSGTAMLAGLSLGIFLPQQIYLFLVSSGGFALLFSYGIILLAHYRLRVRHGCPPNGECQLPGFPYVSWLAIVSIVLIIVSMPLIPGQGAGLFAGIGFIVLFSLLYLFTRKVAGGEKAREAWHRAREPLGRMPFPGMQLEVAEEIAPEEKEGQRERAAGEGRDKK